MIYFLLLLHVFSPTTTKEVDHTHNFHFSHTQIEYSTKQKEWQISMQFFIDDLEKGLANKNQPKLRLGMKKEAQDADQYIEAYLNRYFKLKKLDGENLPYTWIGKEMTEDFSSFWIYLSIENIEPIDGLIIENRCLTHIYEDQQNQINILDPFNKNHQFLFNKDYYKQEINFIND